MNHEVYFFGCWNDSIGHYLHDPRGRTRWDVLEIAQPWGYDIDSKLAPPGPGSTRDRRIEIEGHAAIHHKDGWTCLSWWDRSVDTRGACNAALLVRGTHNEAEMLVLGRQYFPKIMARFTYTITTEAPNAR